MLIVKPRSTLATTIAEGLSLVTSFEKRSIQKAIPKLPHLKDGDGEILNLLLRDLQTDGPANEWADRL